MQLPQIKIIKTNAFLAIIILLAGCGRSNALRYPNDSVVLVKTYELAVSDTGSVLTQENGIYRINIPGDSLLCHCDTMRYIKPDVALYKPIFGRIDQVVINSRNPRTSELYRFEKQAVCLAGYATADSANPYTRFEPPIVILTAPEVASDTSTSNMITLDKSGRKTGEAVKVKSIVSLKSQAKIVQNEIVDDCYLYEVTIARDAVVNFGGQGLIVPDAIVLASRLLYTQSHGLVAEWGLRIRPKSQADIPGTPEMETYLEFNSYSNLTRKGVER